MDSAQRILKISGSLRPYGIWIRDKVGQFLTHYGEQTMLLRLASAAAILALCVRLLSASPLFLLMIPHCRVRPSPQKLSPSTRKPLENPFPLRFPCCSSMKKSVRNNAGGFDFYFKLRNVSDTQTLTEFSLQYPNSIQASAFYLDEGNLAPTGAGFSSMGGGYGFGDANAIVGPVIGPDGTDTLVLRTNADAYTSGTVNATRSSFDDFDIRPATGLVPSGSSVPEPTALALLPVGILGLAIKFRRPVAAITASPFARPRGSTVFADL